MIRGKAWFFNSTSMLREMTLLWWGGLLIFAAVLCMPLWKIYQLQNAEYLDDIQATYLGRWNGLMDVIGLRLLNQTATAPEAQQVQSLNSSLLNELTRQNPQVTGLLNVSSPDSASKVKLVAARVNGTANHQLAVSAISAHSNLIRDQLATDFFILDTQGQLLATNNPVQWQAIKDAVLGSSDTSLANLSLLAENWVRLPLQGLGGNPLAVLYVRHVDSIQAQLNNNLWLLTGALLVGLVLVLGSLGQAWMEKLFAPMDQLNDDMSALAHGDRFLDLHRPIRNQDIGRLQAALQVFQQQNIGLAQQGFVQKLSDLNERRLLATELQRIAQLLPEQEQAALQSLLNPAPGLDTQTPGTSPLALGFQTVSAKVIEQQTRVNELLAQRTADLALIQQALLERTQLDRLREELVLANKLQMANLPQAHAAQALRPHLDLFATMRSAREVGGDFYDYFQLDPKRVVLMVGDASGKGIAAGMLVLVTRTLLRAHLLAGIDVAQSLGDCNRLLAQDNPGGSFTTVFLSVVDVSSGVLTYSNAGHNPPLLRKTSGAIETLNQASGVMLGIMDEWTYQTHQVQLSAGDALLLYSDGVSEAHNTAKELFGSVRLEQAYSLATGDAQTEVARLLECVDAFAAEAEQFDDITILITRYHAQTKVN